MNKLGWIKRRARGLESYFKIPRVLALQEAFENWIHFIGTGGIQR